MPFFFFERLVVYSIVFEIQPLIPVFNASLYYRASYTVAHSHLTIVRQNIRGFSRQGLSAMV